MVERRAIRKKCYYVLATYCGLPEMKAYSLLIKKRKERKIKERKEIDMS